MARNEQAERGAAEYGREALAQWADAARYGVRALAARREAAKDRPSLKERLDPQGGKAGDLADMALAKLGSPGKLASKVKLGSRAVEREASEENGVAAGDAVGAGAPLPLQASIDVALPVAAVFDLCTRFEEFLQIVDRVIAIEVEDDTHFTVVVRAGKHEHELSLELLDERPAERLDWECEGELEHSGVLTFHPLAPRLTRLELTIERASETSLQQLTRIFGLPERQLEQELKRFKAVAELWEDGKAYEPAAIAPPAAEEDEGGPEDEGEEEDETEQGQSETEQD